MKIFRTIPSLVVACLVACGPVSLMTGCGDSGPKTEAGKVAPMQTESIKEAMEKNKAMSPPATKGSGAGAAAKK